MKRAISYIELSKLVNKNIRSLLVKKDYNITTKRWIDLVTPTRFDLMAKFIFRKYRDSNGTYDFARNLYLNHLKAFNNFVEQDESGKVGKQDFLNSFNELIISVNKEGFKSDFLIPIDGQNVILDAAHRTSLAIYHKLDVSTFELDFSDSSFNFSYLFFRKRGMSDIELDLMAQEYLKLKENCRFLLLWPKAKGKELEIEEIIKKNCAIVYSKKVYLTRNGMNNLVKEAYKDEAWLGVNDNGYIGALNKASWCFEENNPLRIYLVESNQDLVEMKEEIRGIFNQGKHAIHINDTYQETLHLSNILLNDNSIHHLNFSSIKKTKGYINLMERLNAIKSSININNSELLFVGGTLGAYGHKEISDLDFITLNREFQHDLCKEIEYAPEKIETLGIVEPDLIYNPNYFFYCDQNKFITLEVLKRIKNNRGNVGDMSDLKIISKLLKGKDIAKWRMLSAQLTSPYFYLWKTKSFLLLLRYFLYRFKSKVNGLIKK